MAKRKPSAKQLAARKRFAAIMRSGGFKKHRSKKRKKVSAIKLVERNESRSTPAKKVYRVTRTKKGTYKGITQIGSIGSGQLKSELKKRITDKIDSLVLRKFHATTKRDKRKIQKLISDQKMQLRKLQ